MKILLAHDGSAHAQTALQYALARARKSRCPLVVLSIFNSDMFIGYEALRAEEKAREEAALSLAGIKSTIENAGTGVRVSVLSAEGNPEELITTVAASERADLVLATPRYRRLLKKTALHVQFVPGTILVPIDNTESALSIVDEIVREAKLSLSKVILLGVIPVNLYGKGEQEALALVTKQTETRLGRMKELLKKNGIETEGVVQAGYADEEIIRYAESSQASLVILPDGVKTPSEIGKVAQLMMEERELIRQPLLFVPVL